MSGNNKLDCLGDSKDHNLTLNTTNRQNTDAEIFLIRRGTCGSFFRYDGFAKMPNLRHTLSKSPPIINDSRHKQIIGKCCVYCGDRYHRNTRKP